MDFANQLKQAALQIANDFGRKQRESEKKQARIALELQQEKATGEAAGLAFKRGADYRVTLGGDYPCPRCWVAHGTSSPLIPQPSDTEDDWFKCRDCDAEFEIRA